MGLKLNASIECVFDDEESARAAAKAVSHEGKISNRAEIKVSEKGKILNIYIQANDVVALRASANAYLRALSVFSGIEELSDK
ncbi:hypothetical protein HY988_06265 [Candidatus Micrarchaeota archaeon]|nr:hypothetical protein [Candidatus Micrarchaeota archaeon]